MRASWTIPVLLTGGGLIAGVAISRLPLETVALAAAAAVAIAVAAAALAEPVLGLSIALIAAPFAPLENIMLRLPVDSGQALLALALGAWGLRALHEARWRSPRSELPLPRATIAIGAALAVFAAAGLASFFAARSFELWAKESLKWIEVLAVFALAAATRDRRKAAWLAGALLISAAFQGAFGLYQFALRGEGPDEFAILREGLYRAYGTFEQPNPYGGYLGLLWPFAAGLALFFARGALSAARAGARLSDGQVLRPAAGALACAAASALALAGLAASWSRGAWLGAAAAAVVMLLALPRRMSASLAFLGAAGLAFALLLGSGLLPASIEDRLTDFTSQFTSFDVRGVQVSAGNYSIIERLAHWQAAQNMILDQPVLGVGFGNYEAAYDQHRALNWPIALGHAHNIYLNVWAETGVVGFAAHIALWITVVAVTLRAARSREVGSRRSQVGSRTLSLGFRLSASDFSTSLAIGLLGAWAHLAVHSLFDSLYVANIYLVIGAFLGLLAGASQPAPSSDLRLPASTFQPLTSHEH